MKTSLMPLLIVAGLVALQGEKQGDKKKVDPPKLPVLEDPVTQPPPRRQPANRPYAAVRSGIDVVQRFRTTNPFMGVWQVTAIVRPGSPGARGRGYVTFTQRFMSMHLQQAGRGGTPKFQSGMRQYRIKGPHIHATTLVGVRNSPRAGEILLDGTGRPERRRYQFFGENLLRIFQANNAYIQLRRVEDLR